MIDLKKFRQNPEVYIKSAQDKQFKIDFDAFQTLDKKLIEIKQHLEEQLNRRNTLTKEVEMKKKAWEDAEGLMNEVKELKGKIEELQGQYNTVEKDFNEIYLRIPNLVTEGVPFGETDEKNVEVAQVGTKKTFGFTPRSHREILEKRGMLDAERGAKVSGSRFIYLRDGMVQLELALVSRAINKLAAKGFRPTMVPNLVRKEAMRSTGFLPYGEDSIYKVMTEEGEQVYLIGTAEVPLVAQHTDEMFDENQVPLRYVGFSPCYRGEAGTYGKDTKGLIRLHQFEKVEMVTFVKPEDSDKELELILAIEEEVYQDLGIPYRKLSICTGDLGVPAAKKYDLEARFPSMNTYREVTSCSNCTDFQTRRCNTKYKKSDKEKEFLHSLNGTVIALARTMAAIVENYQTEDMKIDIPAVLQPYMNWVKQI